MQKSIRFSLLFGGTPTRVPANANAPAPTLVIAAAAALMLSLMLLHGCSTTRHAALPPLSVNASVSSEHLRVRAPQELAYVAHTQSSSENLWKLIANEYTFGPDNYAHARVRKELKMLLADREYLQAVNDRAELFLFHVYHELKKRDMPTELALLPALESGYDPYAYSPAGAVGLWQFIPHTGLSFGLNTTWWHSARRDLELSTESALNYLRYLRHRYDSWPLALAAYNAGERRVNRAMSYNRRRGRPTDFWHLDLPRETERYVPRLIAFAKIFAEDTTSPIAHRPFWTKIYNEEQVSWTELLNRLDLDSEIFFLLNADQNQLISSPHKDHFLIPAEKADATYEALAEMHERSRTKWIGYRLGANEGLQQVGDKFNITTADIGRINDVSDLRQGGYLLIPLTSKQYAQQAGDDDQVRILPPRYVVKSQAALNKEVYYHVRKGDSLWKISKAYGVSVGSIKDWNNIRGAKFIYPGQRILITTPTALYEPSIKLVEAYNREVLRQIYYRVRRGDSLYAIANKFGIDFEELKKWNQKRRNSQYIYPGQHIKLFVDVTDL